MNSRLSAGLFHRLAHDFDRDALHLDVHLHGGDAVDGAGNLEVHLAESVFEALDIRQDAGRGHRLRMRPIATPPTCLGSGTPASMSASVLAHTEPIDDEPLLSKVSETKS